MYRELFVDQGTQNLASVSLESRNLPDPYLFKIVGNKLMPPKGNQPLEVGMSRNTTLDQLEYDAFQDIQSWATTRKEGLAFWISPPHRLRSSQGKIIVSELLNTAGGKVFTNRCVLFDTTLDECLYIAHAIYNHFCSDLDAYYFSENRLRRYPLLIDGKFEISDWLPVLEKSISTASHQWEMIANGEDWEESQRTLEKVSKYDGVVSLLRQRPPELIGNNSLSCPIMLGQQSAFETLLKYSSEGKFVKNCGNCGAEINKVIAKGYVCSNCNGVYEGC